MAHTPARHAQTAAQPMSQNIHHTIRAGTSTHPASSHPAGPMDTHARRPRPVGHDMPILT